MQHTQAKFVRLASRALALGLALGPAVTSALGQVTGYEAITDWSSLARPRLGTAGLLSSYDTRGTDGTSSTNDDFTNAPVAVDVPGAGPGVLTRFWMPHLTANSVLPLRLIVDGGTGNGGYTIATNTRDFLSGAYGAAQPGSEFESPLVRTRVGGQASYEPITFQNSLRLEIDGAGVSKFYQLGYRRLPAGTSVASYNGALSAAQQAARPVAASRLTARGANPAGSGGGTSLSTAGLVVPANGSISLASLTGSGQIGSMLLKLRSGDNATTLPDAQLNNLYLRVRYNGQAAAAIDVPVSHFFGVGNGRADYKSLPLGVVANGSADDGSYYSYWPMPYRNGATVELVNRSGTSITVPSSRIEYAAGAVASDALYLHAAFSEKSTESGQVFHNILNVPAGQRGHYVGNMLYRRGGSTATLEGDEVITVDGGAGGVLHGTGLEDAYNGGYYYNHLDAPFGITNDPNDPHRPFARNPPSPSDEAMSGLLAFTEFDVSDQYRWQITDAVPFTSGINVDLENYGRFGGIVYGSTAFYYSDSAVPEPASLAALAAAGMLAAMRRPRRHRRGV